MGPISIQDQRELLETFSRDVGVLYDSPERQNKMFFGKFNTQEQKYHAGVEAEATAVSTQDGDDLDGDELQEKKKWFLRMLLSLNQTSAKPPTFEEAGEELKLQVEKDLEFRDDVAGYKFKIVRK